MTAQTQKKHDGNRATSKNITSSHASSSSSEKIKLFAIAIKRKKADLDDSFIVNAVQTALEFEGVADLMNLWSEEENSKERAKIIADIQDMLDACL